MQSCPDIKRALLDCSAVPRRTSRINIFIVALGLIVGVAAMPADGALSVTLEKITDVETQDFGDGLGTPVFAQGSVFYSRTDDHQEANQWGIYREGSLIVFWGDEISGNTVNNIGIIDTDGTSALIGAASNHASESPNTYYGTLNISSGGAPFRILSRGSSFPGFPTPHPANPVGAATVDGNTVAFMIREAAFAMPRLPTALATIPAGGGDISVIVHEGDPVPNDGGSFFEFDTFTLPYIHDGSVVFAGRGAGKRGIYEWRSGSLSVVVDSSMTPPAGGSFSQFSVNSSVKEGNDYAFITGATSGGNALYKIINGEVSLVANNQTPVPGGTGNFFNYFAPSLRNGHLLFLAWRVNRFSPPTEFGIYTDVTGEIESIVDVHSDFGGKTPESFSIPTGCAWADDRTVYFHVSFDDNTDAIYRATFEEGFRPVVNFTAGRSGTFTLTSRTGYHYLLRRLTDLADFPGTTIVSSTPGTGGEIAIAFDDTESSDRQAFFFIEERPDEAN